MQDDLIDTEGWIEWRGGDSPLKKGEIAEVKFKNGGITQKYDHTLDRFYWEHRKDRDTGSNVVAYRLIKKSADRQDDLIEIIKKAMWESVQKKSSFEDLKNYVIRPGYIVAKDHLEHLENYAKAALEVINTRAGQEIPDDVAIKAYEAFLFHLEENKYNNKPPHLSMKAALEAANTRVGQKSKNGLLPCPFCGARPIFAYSVQDARIDCPQCKQSTVKASWYGGCLGTAEKSWNTRATPPAPEWQPIETAPKDRAIFGYDIEFKTSGKILWNRGEWGSLDMHNNLTGTGFYPDYWQPLPQPPKKA